MRKSRRNWKQRKTIPPGCLPESRECWEQSRSAKPEDSIYNDGTYTGDAKGYGGNIKVQVVIAGGEITNIEVLSAKDEDEAYYNTAIRIIDNMLDKQTPNVDTISSATYTSTGIKNAVIAALKQAVK